MNHKQSSSPFDEKKQSFLSLLKQKEEAKLEVHAQEFEKGIEEAPDYSFAYSNLAHTLLLQGKFHKATFRAQQALDLHMHNFDALLILGAAYQRLGQFEKAVPLLLDKQNYL